MKILITGKNGQVGHALVRSLAGLGEIIALDRAALDLCQTDTLRQVVRQIKPTLIINAAAYTAVDQAEQDEAAAMRINGQAPGVLAEEASRLGAALIHYSTDYVFDGSNMVPWTEADMPAPLSVYGRSKLAGEQAITAVGGPHLILRTSWVYGAYGKNFYLTMLKLAETRPELRIVADQHGAPTWSRTIADATAHVVRQVGQAEQMAALSGLYHLSAGGHTTWFGFAQKIFAHAAVRHKPQLHAITTADYPLPAQRPAYSVLNTTKFQQTFCRLPQWDDALAQCQQAHWAQPISTHPGTT